MSEASPDILGEFLKENPDVERLEILVPDMNGIFRGKWYPIEIAEKLLKGAGKMPLSTYCVDIWGHDVDTAGVAEELGDPDGTLVLDLNSLKIVPWSKTPAAQVIATIEPEDGTPNAFDPRELLKRVEQRLKDRGLQPVVAAELEFYLFRERDELTDAPRPPRRADGSNLYDLETLAEVEDFLTEVKAAAKAQDIPVDIVFGEYGAGQYEINLLHVADAVQAADYGLLLKRLIRGCARKHGLEASFMARPHGDQVGSSQHVHVSLLEADGTNVFAAPEDYSPNLLNAIGGLLDTMRDFQLTFSPHLNSYRRLSQDHFQAIGIAWGDDNRNLSVRVPEHKDPKASRLEHRLPGSDSNPYLVIASILAGIDYGLENKIHAGPKREVRDPLPENKVSRDWRPAIEAFGKSPVVALYFGAEFQRVFTAVKAWEANAFNDFMTGQEYKAYANRS